MRRSIFILAALPVVLASCSLTRIITIAPDEVASNTYSTYVTTPKPRVTTATTQIYAADNDISLYLDLQGVAAAFAQSSSVQKFENLLNDSSYMLSNLDLNNDGYVDYLRVLETVENNAHVFLIQAVLSQNVYQDVATIVAEVSPYTTTYVQVIGNPYIYGPNYIVQPVFVVRPPIIDFLLRPAYRPWTSPWYWNHFPTYYRRPVPVYLNHYHAYVHTFMANHRYCRRVEYVSVCHFPDYNRISRPYQRDDYGRQYPERSFTVRTANIPIRPSIQASERAVNADDIRRNLEASQTTAVLPASRSTNIGTSTGSAASRSGAGTSAPASRSASGVSGTSRSTTGSSTPSRSTTSAPSRSTTTPSRSTTTPSRSTSSPSRSTTTPSRSSGTSAPAGTSRSSAGQTTVRSRVSSSGSSSTSISKVSPSGSTTSSRRSSGNSTRR